MMRFDCPGAQADDTRPVLSFIHRSVARRVAFTTALAAAVVSAVVGILIVAIVLGDAPAATRRGVLLVAILGGAATVTCVIVATIFVVNRLLTASLTDLTAVLREAEKGRWLKTMASQRPDEIGEVARAFDRRSATVTAVSVALSDRDRELEDARRELKLKEALGLLLELSQTMNAEPDLGAVVGAIPERIGRALGFEQMAVLLLDERAQEFVVRAAFGIAESAMGVTFPRHDAICGAVADSGQPLIIPDTTRDPRYSHFKGHHRVDGAFACVPMKAHGRLVGVFNVLRPGKASISDVDVRLLVSLASYAALAIEHAEASARLRVLTVTDDLTGVSNRRALMTRTRDEMARARRNGCKLSALMLDLDHFKRVNDEHGHLVGDDVLRLVAHALRDSVRQIDTVARWGGEEFVVLLPNCDAEEAAGVAEKLRAIVAALELPRSMTLSAGVAVFPTHADDELRLIDAADQALMRAKRAGRDRVETAAAAAA